MQGEIEAACARKCREVASGTSADLLRIDSKLQLTKERKIATADKLRKFQIKNLHAHYDFEVRDLQVQGSQALVWCLQVQGSLVQGSQVLVSSQVQGSLVLVLVHRSLLVRHHNLHSRHSCSGILGMYHMCSLLRPHMLSSHSIHHFERTAGLCSHHCK